MQYKFGINYDFDRVIHPDFSTTVACRYSPVDVRKVADEMLAEGLLPADCLFNYETKFGSISNPTDLARCGERAMYEIGRIGKDELKKIKAKLNTGLREADLQKAIAEISLTSGAAELADWAKSVGAYQILVSDGWDPMVKYWGKHLEFEYAEGQKPVFVGGIFTGKVEMVDKATISRNKFEEMGILLDRVVGIDDSFANVKMLDGFGLAIAFCPTNEHTEQFTKAGYLEDIDSDRVIISERDLRLAKDAIERWMKRKAII